MPSTSIEQRVRQFDNDVEAIDEVLTTISLTQRRHTNRLAEISSDIAAHGTATAGLVTMFGSVDSKLDQVLEKLGG